MSEPQPWYRWWEHHRWVIFGMLWVFGGFILVAMGDARGEDLFYLDPRRPPVVIQEGHGRSTEELESLLLMDILALVAWGWISHKAGESIAREEREKEERLGIPRKTQETSADLGGLYSHTSQSQWSCPTCGSSSKATRWQGDVVIRECANGHRSVVWRRGSGP